jgi:shikimate dehydrogenase
MLDRTGLSVRGKKALVLGSGGASNTAVAVLQERGAEVIVISRSGEENYQNLSRHADAALLVNATPVGMYPHNGIYPVELALFPQLEGVLDMIYNPARTRLLLDAQRRGLIAENGLWMLIAQAKEAAEWFTGNAIDDGLIPKIHATLCRQMENIILIGMPGCGKSTLGPLVAEATGKVFLDADAVIAEEAGMTIPEIFAREGEDGFRARESAVLADLGKRSGIVLATGGGCVTREENRDLLRQNGTVFWLQRDLSLLPTEGRPLSQRDGLQTLYRRRMPLYTHFADHIIDNNGSAEETLRRILQIWEERL